MRLNELFLGVLVLIGAFAVLVSSFQFSPIPGQAYGADTMPRVIGVAGLLLGLVMVVRAVSAGERVPAWERADWTGSGRSVASVLLTAALIVAYILLAGPIGFIPVAIAILLVLMLALDVRLTVAVPVAIVAAILIQFCFGKLLLVPLPRNPFFALPW